jgi:hypothetical protein
MPCAFSSHADQKQSEEEAAIFKSSIESNIESTGALLVASCRASSSKGAPSVRVRLFSHLHAFALLFDKRWLMVMVVVEGMLNIYMPCI